MISTSDRTLRFKIFLSVTQKGTRCVLLSYETVQVFKIQLTWTTSPLKSAQIMITHRNTSNITTTTNTKIITNISLNQIYKTETTQIMTKYDND